MLKYSVRSWITNKQRDQLTFANREKLQGWMSRTSARAGLMPAVRLHNGLAPTSDQKDGFVITARLGLAPARLYMSFDWV